jgi:hypothetical protein
VLTPGQAADCPRFITVLDKIRIPGPIGRPRTRPAAVAADKAYSSKANRAHLRRRRTRYDKAPESYQAGLHLRGSIMWLKLLTTTT